METQGQVHGPDVGSPTLVVTSYTGCQPAIHPLSAVCHSRYQSFLYRILSSTSTTEPLLLRHAPGVPWLLARQFPVCNRPNVVYHLLPFHLNLSLVTCKSQTVCILYQFTRDPPYPRSLLCRHTISYITHANLLLPSASGRLWG